MRIVYVNLHTNGSMVKMLNQMITGRHSIAKHKFVLDFMINNGVELADYITNKGTTFPEGERIKSIFLRKMEAKFVFKKNNFPKGAISIITNPTEIKSDDIMICRSTLMHGGYDGIGEIDAVKIVDHTHFYGDKETAEALRDKGLRYYMFEVDLNKYSKLYQKNYAWFNGHFIMLPYSFQPRFKIVKNFSERKTKAVAMGTLTRCPIPEFTETYGSDYYQPHRKMILDSAEKYPNELDSYISEYQEKALNEIKDKDVIIIKLIKNISNYFRNGQQKSYFSFDMVDKYNEYKMFICPEDVNGSYGVGTVEGMACGCAMIGWNYGAFEDMGMVAGKHYISYDGTMEDLITKIRYYQKPENQPELESIAQTGCNFIRENYSEEAVAKRYYEELVKICRKK